MPAIQQGLATDAPVINREKTEPVVIARHLDGERDEQVGVNLSRYNLNYVFQPKDRRDFKLKALWKDTIDVTKLPTKVDLSQNWGKMLDQGDLGSCVSNSVAYAIRYTRQKEGLSAFDPSRLFIYYFGRVIEGGAPNEDTGLFIRDGYKSVAQYSVCSERNWPYIVEKFSVKPNDYAMSAAKQHRQFSYYAVDQDLPHLKKCLADGYPVSFGMTVFESFMSTPVARTGQVPIPKYDTENQLGGHAITIVGYDDSTKTFKISNSWGDTWGDKGFCYIPYDYVLNKDYCDDFWSPRVFI